MKRHEIIPEITQALADVEGCSPYDIDYSLYHYADTTAIRSLWESEKTDWELTFNVPDHTLKVRGNGEIVIDSDVARTVTETSHRRVKES